MTMAKTFRTIEMSESERAHYKSMSMDAQRTLYAFEPLDQCRLIAYRRAVLAGFYNEQAETLR